MAALLPLIGGVLAGWRLPRRAAIAVQVALWAVASVILVATAPDHGGSHADGLWIVPALAVVSAATLAAGFWLARRRVLGETIAG